MHRSEVIGVRTSEHLYFFLELILLVGVKVLVHGLNLKRQEAMLEGCRLCARRVIYHRQSELSLEDNVLKVIFVVTRIVRGVARGITHNGKVSCRTVGEQEEVGADLDDARVCIGFRTMIAHVENTNRTLTRDGQREIGVVV
jgi:hypothetical protein